MSRRATRGLLASVIWLSCLSIGAAPAYGVVALPLYETGRDASTTGVQRPTDAFQASLYIYPNSGWSTVVGSKVNSIYNHTASGDFVEIGYYYEDPLYLTYPRLFTVWLNPIDGERYEIPLGTLNSADFGQWRAFVSRKVRGTDDWEMLYQGVVKWSWPDSNISYTYSTAGMERLYEDLDNGNASFRYCSSRSYYSGAWSYWPNAVWKGNDSDYHGDESDLLGPYHWLKIVKG